MDSNIQNFNVPVRKALNLFIFLVIVLGGIIIVFYKMQFNSVFNSLASQEEHIVAMQKSEIKNKLSDVISDLFYLAGQNELNRYLVTKKNEYVVDIEKEYMEMALRKKRYDQICYLNENGQEIVRVNYNDGNPIVVEKKDLQNKLKQSYFKDDFILNSEEVFLSPFDLNMEYGEFKQSLKPVLQIGTPVFNVKRHKQGVVLINYLAKDFLDFLENTDEIGKGRPMLLDNKSFWLFHGDEKKEWGFMFKGRENMNFVHEYPQEWENIQRQESGQLHTKNGLFTFSRVYPLEELFSSDSGFRETHASGTERTDSSQYFWVLLSHVSSEELKEYFTPLRFQVFFLCSVLFVLAALGAWFLSLAIAKRRIYQKQLVSMALYDGLTSLPNRKHFFDRLKEAISYARRYGNKLGLLYIDLDEFKSVNDIAGHEAGDELLVEVSKKMLGVTRKIDTVARLGGDEFAVILFHVDSLEGIQAAGEKLIAEINKPIVLRSGVVSVGASIGGAVYPDMVQEPEEFVKMAEQAMYLSKTKGKNVFTLAGKQNG